MNKVIVSIITPVFNSRKYIAETIRSIISQTFIHWEAILVDDGSTDGTQEEIERFARDEKRIQFYQRNKGSKGASICRNIGLSKATGAYIVFLDADDLLDPVCLEQRINYMKENPLLDFAVFQMSVINPQNKNNKNLTHKRDNYLHAFLKHDLPWPMTSPIWKTEFLQKIGGFKEYYPRLQDPEIHTRALLTKDVKYVVLYDTEPDCYYRQNYKKINLEILLTGFRYYIVDTSKYIKNNKELLSYLNGSQKSAMNHIIRRFNGDNKKKIYTLAKQINTVCYVNTILKKRTEILHNLLICLFLFLCPVKLQSTRTIHQKILNKFL